MLIRAAGQRQEEPLHQRVAVRPRQGRDQRVRQHEQLGLHQRVYYSTYALTSAVYMCILLRSVDRPRPAQPGVHRDTRTVAGHVGGLLANGVGTRLRGDRHVDQTGGERRGLVPSLLAGRGIRTLSHIRGEHVPLLSPRQRKQTFLN